MHCRIAASGLPLLAAGVWWSRTDSFVPGTEAVSLTEPGPVANREKSSRRPPAPLNKDTLSADLVASVVVFLVALPLCMGIAIASGVPPALGLITGIVGGLVVGFLAGSPLQVSGPAAGLAVLVFQLVEDFGLAALGVAVLGGGLIQLVAGLLKFGRWFRAVSPAVIGGMLAGIGVLIFASQFHVMLDQKPKANGLLNLAHIPAAIFDGLFPIDGSSHELAAVIGTTTILSIVLWNRFRPAAVKVVPGPLTAVVVATAAAAIFRLPIQYVEVPENLLDSLNIPTADAFALLQQPAFLGQLVAFALIASAETLLCAAAVDRMHSGPRTDYDRELAAQGFGNMLCGAVGALPMTGVIVRSSANVEAGGKTRYSAIFHGVWLLALVAALPFVLELIPTSALGAILVYTGYRLASPDKVVAMWKRGPGEAVVFVGTVIAIVATDLLSGVLIGVTLALAKVLWLMAQLKVTIYEEGDNRLDVVLQGAATFIRLPQLAQSLEGLPLGMEVHLHVGGLAYIDHACIDLLNDWQPKYEEDGGTVIVEWDAVNARRYNTLVQTESINPRSSTVPPAEVAS